MGKKFLGLLAVLTLVFATSASSSTLTITDRWGYVLAPNDNYVIEFLGKQYNSIEVFEFLATGDFSSPAYCIDLSTSLSLGNEYEYILSDPLYYNDDYFWKTNYETSGQYAVWLMNQFSVGLGFDPSSIDGNSYTKNESAAALQLAIWDAIYDFDGTDGTNNFDRGTADDGIFSFNLDAYPSSGLNTLFNHFKDELVTAINPDGSLTMPENRQFKVAQLDGGQDILVVVPEPATMMLFGIGLLGIGALGRKRRI